MIERIHPVCTSECTHHLVPDRGGVIVTAPQDRDRLEAEAHLAGQFPGKRIEYLGMNDAEDWHTHAWRIGAKPWQPLPGAGRTEGKQVKREIKYEYRPAVWTGNGRPGLVDFSRPGEPDPEPYPRPVLDSTMPSDRAPSKPAADVFALAVQHGWTGVITHSRGCVPHATHGRPGAVKDGEAVRLERGGQRAVAVRMGGSWASLWTWSADQFFTRHKLLDQFKAALAQPVDNLWITSGASCAAP